MSKLVAYSYLSTVTNGKNEWGLGTVLLARFAIRVFLGSVSPFAWRFFHVAFFAGGFEFGLGCLDDIPVLSW